MKTNDENLNNYIDNILNNEGLAKLNLQLQSDADATEKLKGLKTVDNILKNLKSENAPENFTAAAMQKIYSLSKNGNASGKRFFTFVVSFLTLSILSFIGYGIFTAQHLFSIIGDNKIFSQINIFFTNYYNKINNVLFANITLNIFSPAIFIILLVFVFTAIAHNKFMNKLNTVRN